MAILFSIIQSWSPSSNLNLNSRWMEMEMENGNVTAKDTGLRTFRGVIDRRRGKKNGGGCKL